ncbi:hypothetical protein SAMN05660350_00466 [Geodermatophilus obscurus]|uniref:Uncharacterized protein n=1 Tax=Geodermatophilus obscurus TaxID=1861 RepID=A0A1M7S3U2_9ACTN|nr:hypothetical protein [Geodermatophilus obscurus]SHN53158.1 hypothetical protein SAMN05660350_00466 [Geodermatophilus obscurus]
MAGVPQICQSCRHFRPGVPTSAQLVSLIPPASLSAGREVLVKLRERDRKQRDDDYRFFYDQPPVTQRLLIRPAGHPYCGDRELEGVWEDCRLKVKNDDSCSRYASIDATVDPDAGKCATCAHRVSPVKTGMVERLSRLVNELSEVTEQQVGKRISESWNEVRRDLAKNATYELEIAYDGVGVVTEQPHQLSWCREISAVDSNRFAVGEVVNAGEDCARWSKRVSDESQNILERAWKAVEDGKNALDAATAARRRELSDGANVWDSTYTNALQGLKYEYNEAAARFIEDALRALGLTGSQASESANNMLSALLSSSPRPHKDVRVLADTGAEQDLAPSSPRMSGPSASTKPRRVGFLDTLLSLTGVVPPSLVAAEPAPPRRDSDRTSTDIRADDGSTTGTASTAAYQIREAVDPARDGAFAISGVHRHPTQADLLLQLQSHNGHEAMLTIGRITNGQQEWREDCLISLVDARLVQHAGVINGHVFPRGRYPVGKWQKAYILISRQFPARIGFTVSTQGRTVHLDLWGQWLSEA